ncbi:hypothetical protein BXT84_00640 [Sulfobacillus thermotolerans]|uniref:Uncharacterized protein n=1 Tax=Sulfobacillus thermotolerans TaxID=338644 RepID=A0ABN5GZQ8_9FIRM|nr:hypothetical protein BXT84_00640 [Sulfobacillus thermotolerans]
MNTLLRLVTSEGNSKVPPYVVEVFAADDQCRAEQHAPGGRLVHILVNGQETYGLVYEVPHIHAWQVETTSGDVYRFADMPNAQFEGEFLHSSWCCPHCHMPLKPEGALSIVANARIEAYRCVNPRCHSKDNVLFAPSDDNTVSLLGARQGLNVQLAKKCM